MSNKGITQLQDATLPLNGTEVGVLVQNGITKKYQIAAVGTSLSVVNNTTNTATLFPAFLDVTSGTTNTVYTSSPKYTYTPATGELSSPFVQASGGMFVNSNTINNYSMSANSNGMSAGPMTVTGTVVVPSTSTWTVIGIDSIAPWSIAPSAGKLNVNYNGSAVASINTAGDVVAAGTLTAGGTP